MAIRTYHDLVLFVYNLDQSPQGDVERFTVRVFDSPVGEGEQEEHVEVPDYRQLKLLARRLERRELDNEADQLHRHFEHAFDRVLQRLGTRCLHQQ